MLGPVLARGGAASAVDDAALLQALLDAEGHFLLAGVILQPPRVQLVVATLLQELRVLFEDWAEVALDALVLRLLRHLAPR